MDEATRKPHPIGDRTLQNVVAILVVTTLAVSFLVDEKAYVGAGVVAIPTLFYVQWSRWRAGKRLI